LSVNDADSSFLLTSRGFTLTCIGDLPASADHLIVGRWATQAVSDSTSLVPMVE
jgi:hypothetical protein